MIHIVSFGFGHGEPPAAELTVDVRKVLRNPFHDPALKKLTGLDQAVFDHVMATPGAERLMINAAVNARDLADDTRDSVTVAFGCTGGRHRSVALARGAHDLLTFLGIDVSIEHRDVAKDLLPPGVHSRPRPEPFTELLPVDAGRGTQPPPG